jgi:hypothetical protein
MLRSDEITDDQRGRRIGQGKETREQRKRKTDRTRQGRNKFGTGFRTQQQSISPDPLIIIISEIQAQTLDYGDSLE